MTITFDRGFGQPGLDAPRRFASWLLIALLAMLTAACQAVVPRTGPPPVVNTAPPPPAPVPVATALPADAARHRVALLLPLSGANAGVGQSIANATTMALLDARAQNIRMTSYDTAKGARAAAERALADGNALVLGPLLGEEVGQVAAVAVPAGVPVVSYSNDTGVAAQNVFILGHVPGQSVERVVRHARSQGVERIAAMVPRGLYGQRASAALLEAARAANVTVATVQTYDRTAASIGQAVRRVAEAGGVQAVLVPDGARGAQMVAQQLRSGGVQARILGTELWMTETDLASFPALNGAWYAAVSDQRWQQYATNYRVRYGQAPYRLSTLGYDSVLLTVRLARDWTLGTRFPIDRMYDRGGFLGLDGAFRFDDGVAQRMLEVREVKPGGPTVVSPAPVKFAG